MLTKKSSSKNISMGYSIEPPSTSSKTSSSSTSST